MSFERELDAIAVWCDRTDVIALQVFRDVIEPDVKADGSLVTKADRAIESMLREAIEASFPGDAILGEEEGLSREGAARRWIVDPIDATTNFVRGIPIFATLIAVEDEDGLAAGFVSAPALHTRWWATRGGGAFHNGSPMSVSAVAALPDAHVATGGMELFAPHGLGAGVARVVERVPRHRGFGDFFGHMLVAQGSVEAMIDPIVSPWDLAACQIVVEEAGGRFTSLEGARGYEHGTALSSNGLVHDEILSLFE